MRHNQNDLSGEPETRTLHRRKIGASVEHLIDAVSAEKLPHSQLSIDGDAPRWLRLSARARHRAPRFLLTIGGLLLARPGRTDRCRLRPFIGGEAVMPDSRVAVVLSRGFAVTRISASLSYLV
jgi:hypothetical protein